MYDQTHLSDKSIRIVVAGAFSSGKTQFIKSICETGKREDDVYAYYDESRDSLLKDTNKRDVGLDIGKVVEEDWTLYLFGNSGSGKFDITWFTQKPFLIEQIAGFIVMIDSARYLPQSLSAADFVFRQINSQKIPFVVAANCQDMSDALSPEVIRTIFKVKSEIKVLPCIAHDKKSASSVVLELLSLLPDSLGKNVLIDKIGKLQR